MVDRSGDSLTILDTAGQEWYHALGPIYYRDSNGAILVYDVTDPDSLSKVNTWVKELKKMLGSTVYLPLETIELQIKGLKKGELCYNFSKRM